MASQLSRADLLICLSKHEPEDWARLAGALGYEPAGMPVVACGGGHIAPLTGTGTVLVGGDARPPTATPARFLRPLSRRRLGSEGGEEPAWFRQAEPYTDEDDPAIAAPPEARPPARLPLMPWPRLWPFLRLALGVALASHRPDLPKIIDSLARGAWLRRLPRAVRPGWAADCLLLIDFAEPLRPFWDDFHALKQRLPTLRGPAGLTVLALPDGDPLGRVWRAAGGGWQPLARFPLPAPGTPVLVLGDLGCNDRPAHRRQRWLRFGARLKRAGCPPAALTPCPPRRWDGELARLFDLACWDRTARLPRQRGRAAGGGPGLGEDAADTLLALLSPAIRVEPGLLRAARLLLPAGQADVGAEASAWNHADVHAMPTAFYYEPEAQAGHRLRFQAGFEPRVKQALARQLAAHHACLSPFIAHEEAMVLAELLGAEALAQAWPKALADAEAWQRRLAKTCAGDGPLAEAAQAWVGRLAARAQPENLWPAHEALEAAWVLAHREALVQGRVDALPTGLSLNRVAWALGGQGQAGAWVLRQVGGALHAEPVGGAGAALSALGGVPVVNLEAAAPYAMLAVIDESAVIAELADFLHPRPDAITPLSTLLSLIHPLPSAGSPPPKPMPLARPIPLPEAARFRLATDREDWLFDQIDKPDWASGIGRDRQGLYADVQAGAERLRLYWQPGEAGYSAALHVPGTWGGFESLGRDGFGLWADLALYVWREMGCEDSVETPLSYFNRIVQRFRRIAPGRFWMGSPEYEWERFGDETRHEVTLTRGFWLADSACTQAFWQAVTGSNPSRFHDGPDKPVENVSWHDVQGFIARLNEAVPGLAARLPSEAEWEYACRAGTKTPFSFGKSITPEQVNYDGNSPYAGGKKGVYRVKTVPVKCLPPNAWGLHEMHGNVWEWCQDWYARYGLVAQTNPVGPLEGVGRVLRGGSWISYGRRLRSANRHGGGPDTHLDDVGFRLTLGPTSR